MKKVVYRLARGHQILEGEGDLGSPIPTRERKELFFSSLPKGPGCCQVRDPHARFAYHLASLELMSPVLRMKATLAPSAVLYVVQLWTLPLTAGLGCLVYPAQFCSYSAKLCHLSVPWVLCPLPVLSSPSLSLYQRNLHLMQHFLPRAYPLTLSHGFEGRDPGSQLIHESCNVRS